MGNPGEYRKCGIRVSIGKVKIRASTENGESGRVLEMGNPGEYRKRQDPGEYRKGEIQAGTGNRGSG